MEIHHCGLGAQLPDFGSPSDTEAIREKLFTGGIAFIRNSDMNCLTKLSNQLGTIVKPCNEQPTGTGISHIHHSPDLRELFLHTAHSGWDHPPRVLMSALQTKSTTGGESIFVDTKLVIKTIKEQNPSLYIFITSPKHISFRTDEGQFVPRPIYDEQADLFRFRFDDGIQFSASENSRAFELLDTMSRNAFYVSLEPGQGYVIDNHRFLHGQTSTSGPRELLRVLINIPTGQSQKVILFDVDGTLCSSHELSVDAYFSCLSSLTSKQITPANTHVNLHGCTDLGLLHAILDYHGVSPKSTVVEKFLRLHSRYMEFSLSKGFPVFPCPRTREFLEWLAAEKMSHGQSGPIIGLLTGNSRANALMKLRVAGIDTTIFDLGVSSFGDTHFDRIGLIRSSLDKLRASYGPDQRPEHVVVVGDTPLDIECAKQTGCLVVSVATGNYAAHDLAMLRPDFVCEELFQSKDFLMSSVF
ncbi:Clavaminate synthase-like protein [Aspergillus floccosus]